MTYNVTHNITYVMCAELFKHLCLEGLLDVSTEGAPLVSFLQRLSRELHATLHLVDSHQHLRKEDHGSHTHTHHNQHRHR